MRKQLIFAFVLLVGAPAFAAPLKIKNGSTVRVALHGLREKGVGLRPQAGAWRLELGGAAGETAEVLDVTDGAAGDKWMVPVTDSALVFDEARFVPGHAYRVQLRRGAEAIGGALVYLYPPAAAARKQHVVFDEAPAPASDGDDIAITPKSAL